MQTIFSWEFWFEKPGAPTGILTRKSLISRPWPRDVNQYLTKDPSFSWSEIAYPYEIFVTCQTDRPEELIWQTGQLLNYTQQVVDYCVWMHK